MHWHPQRVKHGFEGTLLDESGRVEDENFTSDYRQWFQTKAPGKNPDATGIGWNDHTASIYKFPETSILPIGQEKWPVNLSATTIRPTNRYF